MELDPREASIITTIAAGFFIGLVGYLADLVLSFLTTA
jgi:hypothetical protein